MNKITLLWDENFTDFNNIEYSDADIWTLEDLGIIDIFNVIESKENLKLKESDIFNLTCRNYDDIVFRQNILHELYEKSELACLFTEFITCIEKIELLTREYSMKDQVDIVSYHALYTYVSLYIDIFKKAIPMLKDAQSEGLTRLREYLEKVWNLQNLSAIESKITKIKTYWNPPYSIGFGLNVDINYNVTGITVTDISRQISADITGISKNTNIEKNKIAFSGKGILRRGKDYAKLQYYIYRKLSSLQKTNLFKLQRDLRGIDPNIFTSLVYLKKDFIFYHNSLKWKTLLDRKNIPNCFAQLSENKIIYSELSNPQSAVWQNSVSHFENTDNFKAINIVTGKQQTAKTDFLQAIGANQFLYQLGMTVCAKQSSLPTFQNIYSLFAHGENKDNSRFSRDAYITKHIQNSSEKSLILLNEPYVSTNPTEGEDIAFNILSELFTKNSACFCATHFSSLYGRLKESDIPVQSITLNENEKAYEIVYEKPYTKSYAVQLSKALGFTLENMLNKTGQSDNKDILLEEIKSLFNIGGDE